ncbi:MAG TPA: dienelactone hydrolase family protein [Solirubrobacteraceae bacterium]|nr:dienelactone hydrolase family protein [Solirubrobacteraceae bacterium]
MSGSKIDVKTHDGTADAYLALPDDGQPRHGVLLLMDAFGLRDVIEEMADRIAARGYAVLAPNLFYRAGRAPLFEMPDLSTDEARGAFFAQLRPLMDALTADRVAADGEAYLDALAEHAPEPAAITGYCMGARLGLRIAAAHPERVAALGGFHGGRMVTDEPDSPHRSAGQIRAEVYFGHADNDQSNTPEQIRALDEALEQAGVKHRSDVYEGAAHGYTMPDTAAYDADAAERHYRELFALLDRAF